MTIETARLRLLPYSPEHLLALLVGPEQFEERIGHPAADGMRDFMASDDVSPAWLAQLRESTVADPWIHGFAVVHGESRSVIGSASFKGPPDQEGIVEIAYGIVPDYQGAGMRPRPPRHWWPSPSTTIACTASEHTRSRRPTRRPGCSPNVVSY